MGFFILAYRADPHRSAAEREVFAARDGAAINRKFIKIVSRDSRPANIDNGLFMNFSEILQALPVNEETCA